MDPRIRIRTKMSRMSANNLRPGEDYMIYTGPGFLAAVWFGSSPQPPPVRETTCWGERWEGGWRGAESYNHKKACSSLNLPILSAQTESGSTTLPKTVWRGQILRRPVTYFSLSLLVFPLSIFSWSRRELELCMLPRGQARGPGMSEKALAAPSAPDLATWRNIQHQSTELTRGPPS
jgi:hypothetical protein